MLRITGNEKAVLGGLSTFLSTALVQVVQSGQITSKEFAISLGSGFVVHLAVWTTTNTKVEPSTPTPTQIPIQEVSPAPPQ